MRLFIRLMKRIITAVAYRTGFIEIGGGVFFAPDHNKYNTVIVRKGLNALQTSGRMRRAGYSNCRAARPISFILPEAAVCALALRGGAEFTCHP